MKMPLRKRQFDQEERQHKWNLQKIAAKKAREPRSSQRSIQRTQSVYIHTIIENSE